MASDYSKYVDWTHVDFLIEIKSLQSQLKRAEEVIGFYALTNGRVYMDGMVFYGAEGLESDHDFSKDMRFPCLGQRAREYFKNKDKVSNSDTKEGKL